MSRGEILRMREQVTRYSDEHLHADSFARRIEAAEQDVLKIYMVAGWSSIARYQKRVGSGV